MIKALRGEPVGRIRARDVARAAANYDAKNRRGAPKADFVAALDTLIESRGECCPLPLSDSCIEVYFPEARYRQRERRYRQLEYRQASQRRRRDKEQQQRRRRYRVLVAEAEIKLVFVTPSGLHGWYQRQTRQGIEDGDLLELVAAWSQRFANLDCGGIHSGQPLWSIVAVLDDKWQARSVFERWLDALMVPNKLKR